MERIPLLASLQGGEAASSTKCAKPPKLTQPGWFSFWFSIGKPPRPRDQRKLRDILLLARPPLLAVMQGGEYARFQFVHSSYDRRQLQQFARSPAVREAQARQRAASINRPPLQWP